MLIVGQPRAGKTSLRYKLLDIDSDLPEEDKTTRGIDIEQQEFKIYNIKNEEQSFKYNIWDFGGQQIYQTTHQFFLTQRSLYILVIDTGKDSIGNDDANINYWLQVVELLGGNSPMLLVRNEKNERTVNIDLNQKRSRFTFLKGDFSINLNALKVDSETFSFKKRSDFILLKEDIEQELRRLPLVGFPMPKNWVRIRNELQLLCEKHTHISRESYIQICNNFGVTEFDKQMELSRIFHDLGIFLHFQDYPALEDFIILQNVWATDAVFAVLDDKIVQANKGVFSEDDLPSIWEPKGYSKDVHKKLLSLMMQFELCYEVQNRKKKVYIVPEMLPESSSAEYKWEANNDLPLHYKYDFMPKGLLTRLIVRLNSHIDVFNGQQYVWKTGVKINGDSLDCPNTFAEITEAWDNKQLYLKVQGRFSKDLMSKLTFEIDKLNSDFFKRVDDNDTIRSRWYKMIPCNCIICKTSNDKNFFDYRELLERKNFGKETIECKKKPFSTVSINELIGNIFSEKNEKKNDEVKPKKLVISYSKDDLKLVNKFNEHLSSIKLDGKVSFWYCTMLEAGTNWSKEIQKRFDEADIICFMVSPSFMSTPYIHEHEIKRAFDRKANEPSLKIVPIILDFCNWNTNTNNLGDFTALPYTGMPVVDFKNQNKAWYIIAECLRIMIEKNLDPTGDNFFSDLRVLPKNIVRIYEKIVAGEEDV